MRRNNRGKTKRILENLPQGGLPYDQWRKLRDGAPRGIPTALTWNSFGTVQTIKLCRDIFERADLSSNAKLVYALIDFYYPFHPQIARWQIAGLLGMGTREANKAIKELVDAGLMRVHIHKERTPSGGIRSQPSRFLIEHPKSRFEDTPPTYLAMSIDDFDNKVKQIFPNIDFDHDIDAKIAETKASTK